AHLLEFVRQRLRGRTPETAKIKNSKLLQSQPISFGCLAGQHCNKEYCAVDHQRPEYAHALSDAQ
ncbi:MAG: hypothetical protein PHW09_10630, partial [Desulfovibrio desulfuricans]|nr:hypothetical protein [Desulfovibrio desulfuricans]